MLNIRLTCAAMFSRKAVVSEWVRSGNPSGWNTWHRSCVLFECAHALKVKTFSYEFCRFTFVIEVKLACDSPSLGSMSENGLKIMNESVMFWLECFSFFQQESCYVHLWLSILDLYNFWLLFQSSFENVIFDQKCIDYECKIYINI